MDTQATIIRDLYAAAAGERPWKDSVRATADMLDASGVFLFTPFVPESQGGLVAISGVPERPLQELLHDIGGVDLWYHGLMRKHGALRTGLQWQSDQLVAERDLKRSRFFADYLSPCEIGRNIGVIVAANDTDTTLPDFVLSLFRPLRSRPFTSAHEKMLCDLRPHFYNAFALRQRLSSTGQSLASMAVDRLATAVVVLDRHCKVLLANAAAEKLFSTCGQELVRSGRLRALEACDSAMLELAVCACATYRFDPRLSLAVRLAGAVGEGVIARCVPAPLTARCSSHAVVLVFLSEEGRSSLDLASMMAALYRLTGAEAALVKHLCCGGNIEDFALQRGVRLATVKTQLQAVFGKTGTRRQSDLLRLAFSIAH
jgi:DNA-binding CsgD family transcriptional regulator